MNSVTVIVNMTRPLNVCLAKAVRAINILILHHDERKDGVTLAKVTKTGHLWTLVYEIVPGRYTMGNFRSYKRYFQKGKEG